MTWESWKFLQHSFLEELERTVALLAFEDVSNCPVGDLLDISQRLKTASEVNAAILTSQSHEKGLRMSISFLLFFYFLIFFICPRVCVNRNKCSCVLGWCLLLFVFIWFLCPKRKKREEEIKHLCIVHFHCHATSYVMVTQSIIILDTSSGHPLPFITNIIHKLPLLKLCKEMLTSQACQLDNGVKWASVTVTTSFVSERTFYFWVYHLDIADLRTHINCAWSSQ
jgi:hypothetical protein